MGAREKECQISQNYILIHMKFSQFACVFTIRRKFGIHFLGSGAPNGNFRENICSEDDLRSRIFGAFVVKFLTCLPLLGFSNIYKMV